MTYVLLTACFLLSVVQHARAAPDAIATYLMNTPASLMDFGVFKMERELRDNFADGGKTPLLTVGYAWDDNRILVSISDLGDDKDMNTRGKAVLRCQSFVGKVRDALMVDRKTGRLIHPVHSLSNRFFSHEGKAHQRAPKGMDSHIERMIRIKGSVLISLPSGKYDRVQCEAPLLGTEVFVAQ